MVINSWFINQLSKQRGPHFVELFTRGAIRDMAATPGGMSEIHGLWKNDKNPKKEDEWNGIHHGIIPFLIPINHIEDGSTIPKKGSWLVTVGGAITI